MARNHLFLLLIILCLGCQAQQSPEEEIIITTRFGDMTLVLYDSTPFHKENFLKLAQAGQYDSTVFHRVIEGFMIQGGDIDRKNGQKLSKPDTAKLIPQEIKQTYFHKKGALAAARMADRVNPEKKSSWSQFYLVHGKVYTEQELEDMVQMANLQKLRPHISKMIFSGEYPEMKARFQKLQDEGKYEALNQAMLGYKEQIEQYTGKDLQLLSLSKAQKEAYTSVGGTPFLDGEYTVFGEVTEGLHIIDSIASQPVGGGGEPYAPIFVKVRVVNR